MSPLQKFYYLPFEARFFLLAAPPIVFALLLPRGWALPFLPAFGLAPNLALMVAMVGLGVFFLMAASMQLRQHPDGGTCAASYVFGAMLMLMAGILWANLLTGGIVADHKGIVWGYVYMFGGMGLLLVGITFARIAWHWARSPTPCT